MTQDHFSKQAAAYAKSRPTYPESLFDFLASLPPRREVVWDCACGNGQASVALAKRFPKVIATDLSASQIAQAMPRDTIAYRVATAENSGLPGASVDMTTVAQAFHWLDFDKFFAEVRRVSRPGAVLAVWGYGRHSVSPEIDPVLEKYFAGIVGPYWPPDAKWLVEKYQTIPFPFEEIAAPRFRMELEWSLNQMLAYWERGRRRSAIGRRREKTRWT
jgi:ubiquinone/menaquinone biosynthesis C-methylase UbiE